MCLYSLELAALLEENLKFKGCVYQNELLANGDDLVSALEK